MKYTILLSLITIFISCSSGNSQSTGITKLSPKTFAEKIRNQENLIILDVRTPDEYHEGHIHNAHNVDWDGSTFQAEVAKMNPSTPVYVYCYAGGRSAAAAKELKKKGFKEIYDLDGGIEAWRDAGLPEEK